MSSAELRQLLAFTEEDLAYNRQGLFSPRQQAEDRANTRGCRRTIYWFLLFWAGWLALAWFVRWEILLELAAMLTIFAVLALGTLLLTIPTKGSAPRLERVTGPARLTIQRNRGEAQHILIVGTKDFRIPEPAYTLFAEDGHYAVYYQSLGSRNQIVSLERLSD